VRECERLFCLQLCRCFSDLGLLAARLVESVLFFCRVHPHVLAQGAGIVLVTTRARDFKNAQMKEVPRLSCVVAADILMEVRWGGNANEAERSAAMQLAKKVDCLPQALVTTGGHLRFVGKTISSHTAEFGERELQTMHGPVPVIQIWLAQVSTFEH
jgi:hypothetical protein